MPYLTLMLLGSGTPPSSRQSSPGKLDYLLGLAPARGVQVVSARAPDERDGPKPRGWEQPNVQDAGLVSVGHESHPTRGVARPGQHDPWVNLIDEAVGRAPPDSFAESAEFRTDPRRHDTPKLERTAISTPGALDVALQLR